MKKVMLFLILLVFTVSVNAQDANYNGPAKNSVDRFWDYAKIINELLDAGIKGSQITSKMTPFERSFNETKTKDPSYNISAMEAELKKVKERIQAKTITADDNEYLKDIWVKMVSLYSEDDYPGGMPYGTKYYEAIKGLDLEGYKKKKEELKGKESKMVEMLEKKFNDYDNFIERAGIIKNLRPANTSEAKTPAEKKEMLIEMKMQCEGVLLISPNNVPAKEKLAAINKALGTSDAAVSKFFTSDFHKENYNKIVWSTKPLIIGKENEMAAFIKTSFKTGEPIFGTVYLGRNIKEAQGNYEMVSITIDINSGNTMVGSGSGLIIPRIVQDKSYWQFALIPDENWLKENYSIYLEAKNQTYPLFFGILIRNGEDKHDISFKMSFNGIGAENIKSKLSVDLSGGIAEIKTTYEKLKAMHLDHVKLPNPGMSNPAFEQKMLTAANGLGWNDKFTKIIITSKEWSISKNELTGAILYRSLGAVAITKDTEGKCYYQEFSFRQDYSGGGSYETAIKYGGYGSKRELGCDKIK